MSRLVPLLGLVLAVPCSAAAQRVVDHKSVRMFLNEEVIVQGPLVKADRGPGGAIWFSLGKSHPSATLVIVVPSQMAGSFTSPRDYEGKTVQVLGRPTTGESEGISQGARSSMSSLPRNPFIILQDPSKLKIMPPPPPKVP